MVKYLGPCTYQQIFFKIYTNTFFNFGLSIFAPKLCLKMQRYLFCKIR